MKLRHLIAALCLILPGIAFGQNPTANNPQAAAGGGGAATITFSSYVASSVTNPTLVACTCGHGISNNSGLATGVTFGGVAMTAFGAGLENSQEEGCRAFYRTGATGTGDVVATWATNQNSRFLTIITLGETKQQAPDNPTTGSSGAGATSFSLAMTTAADNSIVSMCGTGNDENRPAVTYTSGTLHFGYGTSQGLTNSAYYGTKLVASAGSNTSTVTYTGGTNARHVMTLGAFQFDAGGGGGGSDNFMNLLRSRRR